MKQILTLFLLLLATLGLRPAAPAQALLDSSIIVAGTVTDRPGGVYSWVVWQASDPALVAGKRMILYRKTGNAASANPFTRLRALAPVTDVRLLDSILVQATGAGEDVTALDTMLTELLQDVLPAGTTTTAEKLSALIRQSQTSAANWAQVAMLGRQYPSIGFASGTLFAEVLTGSGLVTYEVRDTDAAGNDLAVIGRVTLNPASRLKLPAPGAPVEVPETTSKGNLNCSLRWATPNPLRDLYPLLGGYDVWRVAKAPAIARGWHTAPPASASSFLSEATSRRINAFAIMPERDLTAAEAANLSIPTPVFVIDDNGRYQDGGTPFTDGEEFYYFAVARDIAGGSGTPSAGTLVRICDRLAPNPPRNPHVRNETIYNATTKKRNQHFIFEWEPPNLPAGETVSAYLVYRWTTPAEVQKFGEQKDPVTGKPDYNLIAILPGTTTSFTDDASVTPPAWAEFSVNPAKSQLHRPDPVADAGRTYFFTVRAVDGSVCQNVSGNSAPVWGVLRDRAGPAAPEGTTARRCFVPFLSYSSMFAQDGNAGEPTISNVRKNLRLIVSTQLERGLEWAEFAYEANSGLDGIGGIGGHPLPRTYLGRTRFVLNGTLSAQLDRSYESYSSGGTFLCRVGTPWGAVTDWVASPRNGSISIPDNSILQVNWLASFSDIPLISDVCGDLNAGVNPFNGETNDVCGSLTAGAGSKEYKIYRRVDNGPQTLILQGEITAGATIDWCDESPPASVSTLCYFAQTFDEHGNPSPMTRLGDCILNSASEWLPVPMVEDLKAVQTAVSPKLRVRWFCPITNVDRFELWVARKTGKAPSQPGSDASQDLAIHPNLLTTVPGAEGLDFTVFETTAARILSPATAPEFTIDLPVSLSDTYTVIVRAVGPGSWNSRAAGGFSNVVSGGWSFRSKNPSPTVPWPARPLPQVADFHDGIEPVYMDVSRMGGWKGVGIRIGEYPDPQYPGDSNVNIPDQLGPHGLPLYYINNVHDPMQYLFTNTAVAQAEPDTAVPGAVLPVALYRVQVPGTKFPTVPGDIVQVSPLMEEIAYTVDGIGSSSSITDPYIAAVNYSVIPPMTAYQPSNDHALLLLDRQPVIRGAAYKYLLVRFSPTHEIERVIATDEITIP